MLSAVSLIFLRLFLRLLFGLILLSVGVSKLAHPGHFRQAIRDYQLIPLLDRKLVLSTILAYGFPIAELAAGLGLVSGLLLVPALLIAITLMCIFSTAMALNLMRGRTDLSCHCGGAIGDHRISWWLVGRNGLLLSGFLFLLLTPADPVTVATLLDDPSAISISMLKNIVLPVVLLVGTVCVVLVLFNAARAAFRP
jgi:uncharacterized membrane protein YphA (DoxX/SURF4 family)